MMFHDYERCPICGNILFNSGGTFFNGKVNRRFKKCINCEYVLEFLLDNEFKIIEDNNHMINEEKKNCCGIYFICDYGYNNARQKKVCDYFENVDNKNCIHFDHPLCNNVEVIIQKTKEFIQEKSKINIYKIESKEND